MNKNKDGYAIDLNKKFDILGIEATGSIASLEGVHTAKQEKQQKKMDQLDMLAESLIDESLFNNEKRLNDINLSEEDPNEPRSHNIVN